MALRITTYNVLATAYLAHGRYQTPAELLRPERRQAAVTERVAALGADVICLQEVEPRVYAALGARLASLGSVGTFCPKGCGRPDGCATFVRTAAAAMREWARVEYADDGAGPGRPSGTVALLTVLEYAGRALGVANTHLRWDAPGTPAEAQLAPRQAAQLLAEVRRSGVPAGAWVLCGDFNQEADGPACAALRSAGFEPAHADRPHVRTCAANGRARLIDFVFVGPALAAAPLDPPPLADDAVLPSATEPSDHLPLLAEVAWRA